MNNKEIVEAINKYQTSGLFHPYTCGLCPHPLRDVKPLVAQEINGEIVLCCPNCDGWTQKISEDEIQSISALNSSIDELNRLLD